MQKKNALLLMALLAISRVLFAAEGPAAAEDIMELYGKGGFVSIATGTAQPVARAPAVASVITAEDIAAMGATDLDEVLETVPGLHVARSYLIYSPIYTFRGIFSLNNPQVLVMINGIPITLLFSGDRSLIWGGMPVRDIARVEIVRGPGSALYGADALAGVINIVTKTAADIGGSDVGVRTGSFNTRDGWLLHGAKWGDFDVAFAAEVHATDGQRERIDADLQSALDSVFSTQASCAPGPVNLERKTLDTRLDIAHGDWRFRIGYQGRYDVGAGVGVAPVLDPDGTAESRRTNSDLTYTREEIAPNLDVTGQLSVFDELNRSTLVVFPPGAFGGAYPEGAIGAPGRSERHLRLNGALVFDGFKAHRLRLGAGIVHSRLFDIHEKKNFDGAMVPTAGSPPPVEDVSHDPSRVYIRPHTRRNTNLYVQDEWSFAPDWELTAGVRHDNYSDFGDTTNPRLALVWQSSYRLTSKLLYGRAFRAPSFQEQYVINNPAAVGNPDLNPETIDTVELAFDYRLGANANVAVNFFQYRMQDLITLVGANYENTGKQTGQGMELEWNAAPAEGVRLTANYAVQFSHNEDADADPGNAPHHQVTVRGDWRFMPQWQLGAQANGVGERARPAGDTRHDLAAYTVADLTLRRLAEQNDWSFAASLRNVFDADAREPAPATIPNDLPLAGRNFYLEAGYRW